MAVQTVWVVAVDRILAQTFWGDNWEHSHKLCATSFSTRIFSLLHIFNGCEAKCSIECFQNQLKLIESLCKRCNLLMLLCLSEPKCK